MDMQRTRDRERLLRILTSVRRRWRLRIALRGGSIVLAACTAAFLVSAYGVNALRFSPGALLSFRLLTWLVVGVVAIRYLIRPLRRRVGDDQVALYLEEHEPTLEATLLAAVEAEREGEHYSPDLVRGLVRAAVQRAAAVEDGRRIEQGRLFRSGGILAGVVVAALAVLLLAPPGGAPRPVGTAQAYGRRCGRQSILDHGSPRRRDDRTRSGSARDRRAGGVRIRRGHAPYARA